MAASRARKATVAGRGRMNLHLDLPRAVAGARQLDSQLPRGSLASPFGRHLRSAVLRHCSHNRSGHEGSFARRRRCAFAVRELRSHAHGPEMRWG
eukprot:5880721-Prymnesium_polylepis.1